MTLFDQMLKEREKPHNVGYIAEGIGYSPTIICIAGFIKSTCRIMTGYKTCLPNFFVNVEGLHFLSHLKCVLVLSKENTQIKPQNGSVSP